MYFTIQELDNCTVLAFQIITFFPLSKAHFLSFASLIYMLDDDSRKGKQVLNVNGHVCPWNTSVQLEIYIISSTDLTFISGYHSSLVL